MRYVQSVRFCPRHIIEFADGNPEIGLISIACPEDPAKLKEGWRHVLRLEFNDIESREQEEFYAKASLRVKLFDLNQANEILSFVRQLPDSVWRIVVHCDAGISRSAAVALFLSETYGWSIEGDTSLANRHVLRTLEIAIGKKPVERPYQKTIDRGLDIHFS